MKEFFHGWRRKAGVVTLVMACAFVSFRLWVDRQEEWVHLSLGDIERDDYRGVWVWIDRSESLRWEYGHGYHPFTYDGGRPRLSGTIPQWASTFPLTLLSAYLILWKPRKRA